MDLHYIASFCSGYLIYHYFIRQYLLQNSDIFWRVIVVHSYETQMPSDSRYRVEDSSTVQVCLTPDCVTVILHERTEVCLKQHQ